MAGDLGGAGGPPAGKEERREEKCFGNLPNFRLNGGGRTGRIEGDIGGMVLPMGNERFLSKFEIEHP